MFITALKASGYRNLNTSVGLCAPLAVLVGENNAGKSNVVDALRTVLEPEIGPRGRLWLSEDDFAHDGTGTRLGDELEIEVRLEKLDAAEQARMVTCLAPDQGSGVAKLRFKAKLAEDGRARGDWFGGNSQHPDVERHARDAIRFVYLHPLRDAAADLRPGRDNKLIGLMMAVTPEGHPDRDKIVEAIEQANQALDDIDVIKAARGHVADRLKGMTGGGRFQQASDLAFDDPRFNRIVGSLRAKIGELSALDMDQNGLGFNNLLYMAVLLAAISGAPAAEEPTLRVLLVEEPEAHLHPQLQDLLMRFLEERAQKGTQVIVTSHSPNFASSARVERLTVMTRPAGQALPEARVPRDFGLEAKQLDYLRRFLDVTKAALFFARAVILVEGVAEQLLVPEIARRLNRPLAPNGVAVINIGGVAFPPFTDLFGGDRLPNRLAVISDGDAQPADDEDREGAEPALSPRATGLQERASDEVGVFLSHRTLEWDLAVAGENVKVMLEALSVVKPRAGPRLSDEVAEVDSSEAADRLLDNIKDVKGVFAQELAERISNPEVELEVPTYLRDAIEWVTADPHPAEADGEPEPGQAEPADGADDGGSDDGVDGEAAGTE